MVIELVMIMQKRLITLVPILMQIKSHLDHFGITEVSEDQLARSISWVWI